MFLAFGIWAQPTEYRKSFKAMGSAFEVVIVAGADSATWAYSIIDEAQAHIDIIERLISSWDPESQTSMVNDNAGLRPVVVSYDVFTFVERCQTISKLTNGAFDITYASMADIWQFDEANRETWPDSALVAQKQSLVNYQKVYLNKIDQTIFLDQVGMRMGFGAIGKGFAIGSAALTALALFGAFMTTAKINSIDVSKPTVMAGSWAASVPLSNKSFRATTPAPSIIGMDIKKLKRAAAGRVYVRSIPPVMVEPERLMPGSRARAWAAPWWPMRCGAALPPGA